MGRLKKFFSDLLRGRVFRGDGYTVRFGPRAFSFVYEEGEKKLLVDGEYLADNRAGEPYLGIYVKVYAGNHQTILA